MSFTGFGTKLPEGHEEKRTGLTPEEHEEHIRQLADTRCKNTHPEVYDSLACIGPGSGAGFAPPCDDCLQKVRAEF